MNILGINAYHGDAAACLLQDGKLIAAAAEERFNRLRHWAGFPSEAIRFCLQAGGIRPEELDYVAVSRDPDAHLHERVLQEAFQTFPRMMFLKDRLNAVGRTTKIRDRLAEALAVDPDRLRATFSNVEHHRAHLASAFFVSPFSEAAALSVDGFGDFISTMMAAGSANQLNVLDWVEYPHSLGLFYTAVTQYLGFPHYGDESKVMGLAPYGTPCFQREFDEILRLLPDGKFQLNLDYFTHQSHGVEMTWESGPPELAPVWSSALADLLGPARRPDDPLEKRHEDVAATLQLRLELALFHLLEQLHQRTGLRQLCLAGGVALNCTFNGKIRSQSPFRELFIQPAAGDDGTAIGAAAYVYHQLLGNERSCVMGSAALGPAFSDEAIRQAIVDRGLRATVYPDLDMTATVVAERLAGGQVVGWFQGAMEFGPRALGHRSILADPRHSTMREVLNRRIKQREPFRPFAPSILSSRVGEYFQESYPSPFMLLSYAARQDHRDQLSAALHVDGTGRVQTVTREENGPFWTLLRKFEALTGIPALVNTSFNENEPIVCTPANALDCFLRTEMDAVVLGRFVLEKQPSESV